jgi:hypothetical protein
MNMFGIPSICGKYNDTIDRIVTSTNEYINERWKFERGQPPARKVGGRPQGARVQPLAKTRQIRYRGGITIIPGPEFFDGLSVCPSLSITGKLNLTPVPDSDYFRSQ